MQQTLEQADPETLADTRAINRAMKHFSGRGSVWLFGYGSLIFKAGFDYEQCRPAHVTGWARRFWQGSHDHRGTPQAPGRVVTLIEQAGARCDGMAYRVSPDVFEQLDMREKNGYLRLPETLTFADGHREKGLIYIATPDNPAWLGSASEADIAAQIDASSGPSGRNRDYVLKLASALRRMGCHDSHVFSLARHLKS